MSPNTKTTKSRSKDPNSPTHRLAFYLWKLQGKGDSFADACKDVVFIRQYMSMSKKILSQGAVIEAVELGLDLMVRDGIVPYSPQQCIDWHQRSSGKSYYEVALEIVEGRSKPPPIWDDFAYEEFLLRQEPHTRCSETLTKDDTM